MATKYKRKMAIKKLIKKGELNDDDQAQLKAWYLAHYTPSYNEPKLFAEEIDRFEVRIRLPERPEEYAWKRWPCIHVFKFGDNEPKSLNCEYLAGYERTQKKELRKAVSLIIQPQIMFQRRKGFEVDHVYPLSRLWKDFCIYYKYSERYLNSLKITNKVISDQCLVSRWYKYHEKYARYQHLTPKQNRKKGAQIDIRELMKPIKKVQVKG